MVEPSYCHGSKTHRTRKRSTALNIKSLIIRTTAPVKIKKKKKVQLYVCVCVYNKSHDIWYRSSFKELLEDFTGKNTRWKTLFCTNFWHKH